MINCGTCFWMENKKLKKNQTHPNTKFLLIFLNGRNNNRKFALAGGN